MSQITLKANEAATILAANVKNIDSRSKRILQKVVDKKPLSDEEVGELEGIVANAKVYQDLNDVGPEVSESEIRQVAAGETELSSAIETRSLRAIMKEGEEAIEAHEYAVTQRKARRRLVMELRMQHPPMPSRQIAEKLKVNRSTILNDIKMIKREHEKVLDTSRTIELLGNTAEQYDVISGKAMTLADQYTNPMAKAALLRTALAAMDSKSRLMMETGIIHRVPERQEILVAHADAGTVRDRVAKLIHAQEQRSSKVLELPPPIDPALLEAQISEQERISEERAEAGLLGNPDEKTA